MHFLSRHRWPGGGSASATIRNLGALSLGNTQPTGAISSGLFKDEWDSTFLAPADLIVATVFNFNTPVNQNIIGLHLSLFEGATLLASSGTGTGALGESESIPATAVIPGHSYDFIVSGSVPHRTGVYDLNIFVSTVPEMSGWAMVVVGFALVGLQLRRKRRPVGVTT